MNKNIIIGGLVFLSVILIAALIYVWANSRLSSNGRTSANPATAPDALTETDDQVFTFKAGDHFIGDDAPPIADRALAITATIDTQQMDGVIIAQGGLAHGYALYVQDGELFFAVRRNQALTTVSGGKIGEGRHTVTATWTKDGILGVGLDGRHPAAGKVAGAITVTPTDGLDVGEDRYAPVGLYAVPNSFGGTIEVVTLRTSL